MISQAKPYARGAQLLKILGEHGALSVRGLEMIVAPKMTRRRLRESLGRLQKQNYVMKMYDAMFGGAGVFYRLNYDDLVIKQISKKIGVTEDSLIQPTVRRVELLHSERCAIWAEVLSKLLPHTTVLRDFSFAQFPVIEKLLMASAIDFERRPDLLVLGKSLCGTRSFAVAIEIERTLKSNKRLFHKLRKYASALRTKTINRGVSP